MHNRSDIILKGTQCTPFSVNADFELFGRKLNHHIGLLVELLTNVAKLG